MSQKTLQLSQKLLTLLDRNPGKQPNCRSSNLLGYIRSLEWAKSICLTPAAASTTPLQDLPSPPLLLLLLDVPFPDLKSLFLHRLAPVHQEDRSSFTRKSTHSQERACKCTFDFHSQVTSPLKNVLASALLTFTHKSPRCCLHPIWEDNIFKIIKYIVYTFSSSC